MINKPKGIYLEIQLAAETFFLLHHKAVYRPKNKQLILADLHLGKASHFRKKGIAMPAQSHLADLEKLSYLLRTWQPKSVLLLGDLFHSEYNREWLWFESLLKEYPEISFTLVMGNHDILPEKAYTIPNLKRSHLIEEKSLVFSHAPLDNPATLNFCGHVHPGLQISGRARESFRLPCFYSGKNHFILPAFGALTGLFILEKEKNADYYLVTRDTLVKI